jgi:5-methylcytosine-specific restriction endonuclease McrA
MKHYNATHPRKDRKAYKKAYDEANKDRNIAYRVSRADELKAQKRAYYRANREKILAYHAEFDKVNKERILDYQAKRYVKKAEKIKAAVSAYRKANPDKKMHLENKRRARKFNNGGSHTLDQLIEKFARLGNVCFYCGNSGKLTIDHDVPLSRGGTDDIDNILPACKRCNCRKHDKTSSEFIEYLHRKEAQSYEGR